MAKILKSFPFGQKFFVTNVVFPLILANDNDMTMDEGMAFTIGELPLDFSNKISVGLSMGLIFYC